MAFNGTEGEAIELELASNWTANFRAQNPDGIKAHFFGKEILNKILQQDNCMGIRIYNAIDDEGTSRLILVGADQEESDQINGTLAEFAKPCPAICGKSNVLNSDTDL